MSLDATRWAWKQTGIRPADKLVLLSMADRADESHRAWPSIDRVARDTGLDRKTVMVAIDRLAAAGLLRPDKRHGKGTIYHLIGVEDLHDTGDKNGTSSGSVTSPKNGTRTRNGTSTKNGTTPVPKTGPVPVPKTGHESTSEPTRNLNSTTCAAAHVSVACGNATARQPCPHRKIIDLYNEILPELPGVLPGRWGGQREKDLAARWREDAKHQDLAFWAWFFRWVRANRFYLGENDRGWRANLGWLVQRRNFDKILEAAVSAQRRRAVA